MADQLMSPTTIAILLGLLPSVIWLFFWLHLARTHPEPPGLLFLCFVLGAVSVFVAVYAQNALKGVITDDLHRTVVWAAIEEVCKLLVFYFLAYRSDYDNEAIDPPMYLIAVALGFAALENILYLWHPTGGFDMTAGLLTGTLRFFGSTLLHTIASAFIGIVISLMTPRLRSMGLYLGLAGAIFLHATFNFFILKNDTASALQVYGYLWVSAIISHVMLEKLRRITSAATLVHV